MNMVHVRLKEAIMGKKEGDIVKIDNLLANKLIDSNKAEYADKSIDMPLKDKMVKKMKRK